jgi:MFS superfamily sulfate permease-like transporter
VARSSLFRDGLASAVVFLIALPLCMGVAIASGVPPAAGLVTGIVGGLLVGLIQSPSLQVSGPTATLAVTILVLVQTRGAAALGITVVLAGLLQLVVGLLRGGRWFRIVPPSVVYGMLAGIGVLIAVSQFHLVVDDAPKRTGLENLITIPGAIWKGLIPLDGSSHHKAAAIGLLTIAVMVLWNSVIPKRFRVLPAPLAAVLVATAVAGGLHLDIRYVAVPDTLFGSLTLLGGGSLAQALDPVILTAAVSIAVIASAETLLSAVAIEQIASGQKVDYERCLATQGIGNILCGLLGGLPMAGVIVRSTANVEAGAHSRVSVVLHGVWLLGFVMGLPFLLARIPVACLAAILVYTGYKLVSPAAVRTLKAYGREEVAIYAVTVVAIVTTDLLRGVLVGLALAALKVVYALARLSIRLEHDAHTARSVLNLSGSATFLRLPALEATLAGVPPERELHVQLQQLNYLDHATLELLSSWAARHRARGGKVEMAWGDLQHRGDGPRTVRRAPAPARPPLAS